METILTSDQKGWDLVKHYLFKLLNMRGILLQTLLLFVTFLAFAQNPALEFAAGSGNPTGNGPVTSTTIQLRNNTNNPSGNTFATYNPSVAVPLTVTAELTNHQYNMEALPGFGQYFADTGLWDISNMSNGASATPEITAIVNAKGDYLNTASITGDINDPNMTNNEASACVTVNCNADIGQVPLSSPRVTNN